MPLIHKNAKGFSLIEILLAIALVVMLFAFVRYSTAGPREYLRATTEKLDILIGYATQESIMRSTIVRLRFSFDNSPQEWNLEYGPDGDFVLPSINSELGEDSKLNLAQKEKKESILKKNNQQFQPIPDFEQGHENLRPEIMVLGLATSNRKDLINYGDTALYFYPTGERDAALLLLGINDRGNLLIAKIQIQAYIPNVIIDYITVESTDEDTEMEEILLKKSQEIHQEWLKG